MLANSLRVVKKALIMLAVGTDGRIQSVIAGFRRGVNEIFALLRFYAAQIGS
jgi:hypothetical protein